MTPNCKILFSWRWKSILGQKSKIFWKIEDTIGQGWMRNSPDVYNRSIEVGRRWIRQLCVRHLLVISPHHISQVRTVDVRDRRGWPVATIRRPRQWYIVHLTCIEKLLSTLKSIGWPPSRCAAAMVSQAISSLVCNLYESTVKALIS